MSKYCSHWLHKAGEEKWPPYLKRPGFAYLTGGPKCLHWRHKQETESAVSERSRAYLPDMMVRRLIISDLHFGSGDDLLSSPEALERIEAELQWADELVVNGDLLELVFASLQEAVAAARPFLALANQHVQRIHYLPGNHDHHLVALAGDEKRFTEVLGISYPEPFRVRPAERLLKLLCPDTEIVTAYPICELDGLRLMHGHYMTPHAESFGWRMMDRLAWSLTGFTERPQRFTVADYEALIGPLYELMYEMANLPQGRRAQQQFERWLVGIAAVARAPVRATRQASAVAHAVLRRGSGDLLDPVRAPTEQVLAAMRTVCENLDVSAGRVVFAHTHIPLVAETVGPYEFYNSGSWLWDPRMRHHPDYRRLAWPGTALRATGGELELVRLLDDCTDTDLQRMLGSVPLPGRRRCLLSRRRVASQPACH